MEVMNMSCLCVKILYLTTDRLTQPFANLTVMRHMAAKKAT